MAFSQLLRGFILISPLAILLTAGNILSVRGFITKSDIAAISKFLFWIISPALLFRNAFHIEGGLRGHLPFVGAIVAAALATALLAYITERFIFKERDARKMALTAAASVRPNTIYVGLPIVESVFGPPLVVLLSLYAAVAIPLYNLLSPLSSEIILAGRDSLKVFLKNTCLRIIKNPMVVAPLCGMLLVFAGLESLPDSLDKALHMVSSAATGMSLLVLGASIDVKNARGALLSCWREIAARLFVHPAMLYFCLTAAGVELSLKNVSVLVTATPTAATLFVLARGIGLDGDHAAELTVITMLLSAVTIPVWIAFLGV